MAEFTNLTRNTAAMILKGLERPVFGCYRRNPEEFLTQAARLINEQKATIIVEQITYNLLDEHYDVNIFAEGKKSSSFANAYRNHCLRLFNFCVALAGDEKAAEHNKIAIAAVFHDNLAFHILQEGLLHPFEIVRRDILSRELHLGQLFEKS